MVSAESGPPRSNRLAVAASAASVSTMRVRYIRLPPLVKKPSTAYGTKQWSPKSSERQALAEPARVLAEAGDQDRNVDRSALGNADHSGGAGADSFDRLTAGIDSST